MELKIEKNQDKYVELAKQFSMSINGIKEDSEFIKLVELREAATNDLEKEREYKKVVYQIMLGAGLDTYTKYFKEKDLDSIANSDIAHYDFQRYTAPETRTMTEDVTST